MAKFLLQQVLSGTPIGVWDEDGNHYYTPEYADRFEKYGQLAMDSRGVATSWDDWCEQQASKTPSPNAMWDIYEHPGAPLEDILQDALDHTSAP